MKALYEKPISSERFQLYIGMLQGNTKGDLSLPIGGYNPMAKEHVLEKLIALEELGAEGVMQDVINEYNSTLDNNEGYSILVVLNLADDLKGGWTNRYTTDFDSKFKINALVERNFCTPFLWTSEAYTEELIRTRTKAYIARTLYWKQHAKPRNMEGYLQQEVFVSSQLGNKKVKEPKTSFAAIEAFYQEYKSEDNFNIIFNFFYGDVASRDLEYPCFGVVEKTGFDYAEYLGK
ncbi:MAG: hypothetical protein AB8F95_14035 [Bacteroidia bacterium]